MADKNLSKGATIAFGTSTWVADVFSYSIPEEAVAEEDITTLSSTVREYAPGWTDIGPITIGYFYDAANHPPVGTSAATETITLTIPSGAAGTTTIVFDGFASSNSVEIDRDGGYQKGTLTLRSTGDVVITPPV